MLRIQPIAEPRVHSQIVRLLFWYWFLFVAWFRCKAVGVLMHWGKKTVCLLLLNVGLGFLEGITFYYLGKAEKWFEVTVLFDGRRILQQFD